MKENTLLIFVKNPQVGKVKTRLAKTIGDKKALSIYQALLKLTERVTAPLNVVKMVYYNEWIEKYDVFSEKDYHKALQANGNLGEKMKQAFKTEFENGAKKVVIIGSDCPEIETSILEKTFKELDTHQIVIGPAVDGGYYLLGMNTFYPFLFEDKPWSTAEVYSQSVGAIQKHKLDYFTLPTLRDIDTEEDYILLKNRL